VRPIFLYGIFIFGPRILRLLRLAWLATYRGGWWLQKQPKLCGWRGAAWLWLRGPLRNTEYVTARKHFYLLKYDMKFSLNTLIRMI